MTPEEEAKKTTSGYGYNSGFSAARSKSVRPMITTGSSSTTQTSTTTREKPDEFTFTPPQQTPFTYNPEGGIMQFFPQKPGYDEDRERRLKQVERVASLGEVFKSLGQLAGGGYAPVRENGENKTSLRAFAELDRMRREHSDKLADWENRKFVTQAQDYQGQKNAHVAAADKKEGREFGIAKANYDAGERFKDTTATRKGQSYTSTREDAEKFLTENAYTAFRAGGGNSKKDFVYYAPDGTFTIDKDRLNQFYTILEKKNKKSIQAAANAVTEKQKEKIGKDEMEIVNDLELMKSSLIGENKLTDENFRRVFGKYIDMYRDDADMKYILDGTFMPKEYDNAPPKAPKTESQNPKTESLKQKEIESLTDLTEWMRGMTLRK